MQDAFKKSHFGFTLIEFLVAILIVAILAAIAIPQYVDYVKKSYYSEVIQTADLYKDAVTACLEQREGKLVDCNGGRYGIPPNHLVDDSVGQVKTVIVNDGVITVTPKATHGIKATETYILTPEYSEKGIQWKISGGACKKDLVEKC